METSSESKHQRATNFNSKEEAVLLSIVTKYKGIIENKKTDSNNNKQKLECWEKIEVQFNNHSGEVFRDWNTLRKKYENIKKRTKRKIADAKCHVMSTGGGPPNKPIEVNDVDILVRDILGSRVEGLQSEFGGDASISGTEIITIECEDNDISFGIPEVIPNNDFTEEEYAIQGQLENTQHETKRMDQMKEETKAKMDWSKSTPDNLRTPKSKVLISGESGNKRKRNEYETLCSKVSHWAEAKSSLEQIKISQMEKEHNLKLKIMKDKSEAEIEMMRKETEARIDNSRKELEVTLEGIREQNNLKKEILLLEKHFLLLKKSQNSEMPKKL